MGDVDHRILDALDQAPVAVAVLRGEELRYVYLNDQYRRLFPSLRVGDRFGLQTEQGPRFRDLTDQVIRSGQPVQLRDEAVDLPHSGRGYLDVLIHPLRDRHGVADGVILIGNDVTAAVLARRALEEQTERTSRAEAQLRTVLQRGPLFVTTFDPKGNILFAAGGQLRMDPADLVGKNALELYADDPIALAAVRRALTGETFSALVPRPGGAVYELYYVPIHGPSRELQMVVASGVNVTRRLRAEEERARIHEKMLQRQKLESLGVLAGGIAHDFNNLLTVIQGNAAVALARVPEGHPARELIDDILKAGQRATDLTRQMLAYSGKGRFQIGPIDLRQQVSEIAALLRTSVSKKVLLRVDNPSYLPAVQGDASQLQQVIMNLVLNAAEAVGNADGEVAVRVAEEEIGGDGGGDLVGRESLPPGRYVRLTVEDTGAGMDAHIVPRIFDPFFTTKTTGRGLGLAAVLGIVRSHGGALRIRSKPGEGTCFEVLLPAAGARAQPPLTADAAAQQGHGTVLVIDDESTVRTATGRMLSLLGYDVLEAPDGEQGLEIFRLLNGAVDAVLLDLTMPGLSGEETLQLLRQVEPEVQVVVFSGYAEDDVARRLQPLQPAAILAKPFTRQQLAAALQTALADVE
jgi:two-component system cell cycle sensor histidine kinase/response regulator CckA